jgi:protein-S-isoprenylcysteine O-methyltransferase Ste14
VLVRPWEWVWLAGFVLYAATRHIYERRVKASARPTVVRHLDRTEKILLAIVSIGILLPLVHFFTPLIDFAAIELPAACHWAGLATMLIALWLFRRSHADLGEHWSVTLEIREAHRIVEHGVYRRIRHPMYAAIWLFSLAQALLIDNWIAGPSALVTFAPLYLVRTPREEALLREHFGEAYREYERRTGRLIPRVQRE